MSHPHGEQPGPANPAPAAVPQQPSAPEVEQMTNPAPAAYPQPQAPAAPPAFFPAAPTTQPAAAEANPTQAVPVVSPAHAAGQYQVGTAAVPGPDAPVSVTPGYAPISATPYGYGYGAPAAPPKKGRTGTIVLSIATAVLALAAAAMTTLYFVEHSQRAAADKTVAEQTAAMAANEEKIEELDEKVKVAKEEAAKLEQELTGSKNKTDEVTKEREALASCFRAIEDFARSQSSTNRSTMEKACDEASKYY